MQEALLKAERVEICFGEKKVIDNVSFSMKEKEILAIVGESGSGKSTLLKAITGLLGKTGVVTAGDLLYRGKSIANMTRAARRPLLGAKIATVFQDCRASFSPIRTIGAQITEGVAAHEATTEKEAFARAAEIMERIGLADAERIWNSYPFELSGGMSQRAGLCAAMVLKPALLLADEPTSALDASLQARVVEEMRLLRDHYKTAILLVTHHIGVAGALADRVLVLKDGRVEESGTAADVLQNPKRDYTKKLLKAAFHLDANGEKAADETLKGTYQRKGKTLLKAENLTKIFSSGKKELTALQRVSFAVHRGESLAIVGESGSGKSTLAKLLLRLLPATEGKIFLENREISSLRGGRLRELYTDIQMVFQLPIDSFDPRKTLGYSIGESLKNKGVKHMERREKAAELLKLCGLDESFAARYPHEVSGGQCQRAAIARALAVRPKLLVCDEATSALDATVQRQILELLLHLKEEQNLSLIFISHDLALVQRFCDYALVLHEGHIIEEGPPRRLIQYPRQEYTRQLIAATL